MVLTTLTRETCKKTLQLFFLRAEQTTEETNAEEEPGPIEQATAAAAEELQRLSLDGAAKVTNVKVTTDEREVNRRELFAEKMRSEVLFLKL